MCIVTSEAVVVGLLEVKVVYGVLGEEVLEEVGGGELWLGLTLVSPLHLRKAAAWLSWGDEGGREVEGRHRVKLLGL